MSDSEILELEEIALECHRGINSLHARLLGALAGIAARSDGRYRSESVALLLTWTPTWAADQVALAEGVVERLPASLAAMGRGEIDLYKVRTVHELTMNLAPDLAREVEERVLEKAAGQTGAQMRQRTRRIVQRVDPAGARDRAAEPKTLRCAGFQSEDDGMAKVYAVVPADKAVAIALRVDKIARQSKTPDDPRTMDQRRADVVCDLLLGKPSNVRVSLQLTVPVSMLMGLDDQPGELAGFGPIDAATARELAGDATWRRLLTDERGTLLEVGRRTYRPPAALRDFVQARDKTCVFPGCAVPAHRADLDHTTAFPDGPTEAANLGVMCRAHHRLKSHDPRWTVAQPTPGTFVWTSPSTRVYVREPVAA
ncbi:MAG: DUF222 domain-containing protein [Umezawaea sp.]